MYYGKDGYWKKVQEYLPEETLRMVVRSPLELTETLGGRMSILWE